MDRFPKGWMRGTPQPSPSLHSMVNMWSVKIAPKDLGAAGVVVSLPEDSWTVRSAAWMKRRTFSQSCSLLAEQTCRRALATRQTANRAQPLNHSNIDVNKRGRVPRKPDSGSISAPDQNIQMPGCLPSCFATVGGTFSSSLRLGLGWLFILSTRRQASPHLNPRL